MLTAIEKFQQSGHSATHKKWAESLDAEAACDYALLALVEEQDAIAPLDSLLHAQVVGARRYRELLLTLHKTAPKRTGGGLLGSPLRPPS